MWSDRRCSGEFHGRGYYRNDWSNWIRWDRDLPMDTGWIDPRRPAADGETDPDTRRTRNPAAGYDLFHRQCPSGGTELRLHALCDRRATQWRHIHDSDSCGAN